MREEEGREVCTFCCLGVLCSITGHDYFHLDEKPAGFRIPQKEDTVSALPTDEMLDKFGLPWEIAQGLAQMNDTKRMTFPQIADWIEQNL